MANVFPLFDLEYFERFFAPIAECVAQFARRRNLALVKYDHESPYWDLLFAHPIGGCGKLVLGKSQSGSVELSAVVWRDDYDAFTRHVRWMKERDLPERSDELNDALDRLLDEVLGWRLDEQFRAVSEYQPIWSKTSKQEFLASQPAFPVPTGVR